MNTQLIDEKLAVDVLESLMDLSRADEFIAHLDDNATWVIPGSWKYISGTKDRAGIEKFVRVLFPAGFPSGVSVEIHHVHTSGSTALIEFTARATTSKDRQYENQYCFVFEFEGDRVLAIREYMDTMYADVVLHQ